MKKKLLALVLSAVMILSLIPIGTFTAFAETVSGTCGENLTFITI